MIDVDRPGDERPCVVVGVDGSDESIEALCWAVGYARRTGGRVRAVISWQPASTTGYAYAAYGGVSMVPGDSDAAEAEEFARRVLATVIDALGATDGVVIDQVTAEGHPAAVLIEQSRSADLLAVGARGRNAFAGMVLGSVSSHCVHHAHCPILVVRRGATDNAIDVGSL